MATGNEEEVPPNGSLIDPVTVGSRVLRNGGFSRFLETGLVTTDGFCGFSAFPNIIKKRSSRRSDGTVPGPIAARQDTIPLMNSDIATKSAYSDGFDPYRTASVPCLSPIVIHGAEVVLVDDRDFGGPQQMKEETHRDEPA